MTYNRWPVRTLAERFWSHVDKSIPDGCWPWTGFVRPQGYGDFFTGGTPRHDRAHRVAWALANGPIPDGLCVLHACDNRACCNPAHLWLGTYHDNNTDKVRKGRGFHTTHPDLVLRGERIGTARLTEEQVVEIRARYSQGGITHQQLATEYGVARTTIGYAVRGIFWRHVK